MQTAKPDNDTARVCVVLRPFCVAGEPLAVDTRVTLPVTVATELAAAAKLRILGTPAAVQAAEAEAEAAAKAAAEAEAAAKAAKAR